MRRRFPSISALTSFEAAARYESFTLAAEELGITQGAANRQVRELERLLGVDLFRREGRAVRLTDAGTRLADEIRVDLRNLDRTIERAAISGATINHIAIGAPPTFAARWLVPRLSKFLEQNPQISISVRSFTDVFNLLEERIDLAIHYGTAAWPGAQLQAFFPEDVVAVVAPELVQLHDLSAASDLVKVPPIYLSSRAEQWIEFRASQGLTDTAQNAGILFDQFSLVIAGAMSGLGAALIPSFLIESELDSGALKIIAKLPPKPDAQYYLATPFGHSSEPVAKLASWLRREAKKSSMQSWTVPSQLEALAAP